MKKNIIIILIIIFILTVIAGLLSAAIYDNKQKKADNLLTEQERKDKDYENSIINKLTSMSEIDRIETYFGEFLKYIEDGRYEKSYELLNEKFRNRYFPSVEQFTEYVKNKYPAKNIAVDYNKLDTYGDIFVLTVNISEVLNDEFDAFKQRIVIRENSANDFKISFQVEPDKENTEVEENEE